MGQDCHKLFGKFCPTKFQILHYLKQKIIAIYHVLIPFATMHTVSMHISSSFQSMIEAWAELNASDYTAGISPFPVDEKLQKCTAS